MSMTKTIKISDTNHEYLNGLCNKDESYNDALSKVIKIHKRYKDLAKEA